MSYRFFLCGMRRCMAQVVHVDMRQKLEGVTAKLTELFPPETWPPHAAVRGDALCHLNRVVRVGLQVRELATQIKKLKKEGFACPLVFADLRK